VARRNPRAIQFTASIRPAGLVAADGSSVAAPPDRPLAVSGIARPDEFLRTLDSLGIVPAESLAFADHRRYGDADVDRIEHAAEAAGAPAVVTTEKDLVKLAGRLKIPVFAVRLAVEIAEPGFPRLVAERLFARPGARS
jgi:tetraacyldisaccharide-1-P 4'-kinase